MTKPKKQTTPKKTTKKKGTDGKNPVSNCGSDDVLIDRYQMIQEAAYYRAEKRNFVGGDPIEDWIASEIEVETRLSQS